jgi:hypothetical protein
MERKKMEDKIIQPIVQDGVPFTVELKEEIKIDMLRGKTIIIPDSDLMKNINSALVIAGIRDIINRTGLNGNWIISSLTKNIFDVIKKATD